VKKIWVMDLKERNKEGSPFHQFFKKEKGK
jgi:hypothetical protein